MATIDTVKEVLVENLDLDADAITEEATLESLGIDSLDMVELICDLEEKCDVDNGTMMAGQVAALVRDRATAAEAIAQMMAEAEALGARDLVATAAANARRERAL